jgi:hypothetical protein
LLPRGKEKARLGRALGRASGKRAGRGREEWGILGRKGEKGRGRSAGPQVREMERERFVCFFYFLFLSFIPNPFSNLF